MLDKFLRLSVGLLVGTLVARYLGPDQFGMLNYAIAVATIFGGVGMLGLDAILVKNLVQKPDESGQVLGTAFILRIFGGFIAVAATMAATLTLNPGESNMHLLAAIAAASTTIKGLDLVRFYFESKVNSKYTVIAETSAFLVSSLVKLLLIGTSSPLLLFSCVLVLETLISLVIQTWFFRQKDETKHPWVFNSSTAKRLVAESWPLIFSGLAIIAYMKTDQIMLGKMLGNDSVGIYSAATRLSEIWYLFPVIIAQSYFPSLLQDKSRNHEEFTQKIQRLMDGMVALAISIAIPVSLLSPWIIRFLYGEAFSSAALVLQIHIWGAVFVFLGVIAGRWYLSNNLQHLTIQRSIFGLIFNVVLNVLLIPKLGVSGAAIATVCAHFVGSYLANSLNRETREIFFIQTNSLLLPVRGANMLWRRLRNWPQ